MRTKSGRFNYLPNYQQSPEGRDSKQRVELKEIISKLAREHQPKNTQEMLALDSPPRRTYSPIGQIQLKTRQGSNHIRSIILNEQNTPNKHQESRQKNDAYRIIKDSHIPKDHDFNDFYEKSKTPPKIYYSPFQKPKITHPKQPQPIIKFYKIESSVPVKDQRQVNPARKNQPYVNLTAKINQQSDKNQAAFNPQSKMGTPKMSDLASSRKTNNKVYRLGKSQERIYAHQTSTNHEFQQSYRPPKDTHLHSCYKATLQKRSCYDYVPQQMKSRLRRQQ